jgi:hypothetical protein
MRIASLIFVTLVLGLFVQAEAAAQLVPKDPLFELTPQERESLRQAACGVHPAASIEARYRERPWRIEYAFVECAPYWDGQGSTFAKIVSCPRNIAERRWECTPSEATVKTRVDGYSVSIRYKGATVPQALAAISFALSMPNLAGFEPGRFSLSEMSVRQAAGQLSLTVHVDELRVIVHLDPVSFEGHSHFCVKKVQKCRSDICMGDPDDPTGLSSIAPKYRCDSPG